MGLFTDIENMVKDFNRIICLVETMPKRIRNVKSGVIETAKGSIEYIEALGESAVISKNEIFRFVEFISIIIFSYLDCIKQFTFNLYKCILWYGVDILGKLMYLPISIGLLICKYVLNVDLYSAEAGLWNFLEYYNGLIRNLIGVHVIHFPDDVRKDCYICKTLKGNVISTQGKYINKTFNEIIPGILASAGREKLNRGSRLYNESINMYAREPEQVE